MKCTASLKNQAFITFIHREEKTSLLKRYNQYKYISILHLKERKKTLKVSFVLVLIVVQILDRCADIQLLCRYSTVVQIFDLCADIPPLCRYAAVLEMFDCCADMQPLCRYSHAVHMFDRCGDIRPVHFDPELTNYEEHIVSLYFYQKE